MDEVMSFTAVANWLPVHQETAAATSSMRMEVQKQFPGW